ncbi:MAG: hypothetical protein FGM29_01210 [Actinobacteria bacterium]|nr:hypothetical protein [Actinomycetota bacterium]
MTLIAMTIVVMMPAIVAVASNLFVDWHPTGDMSLAELMMRGIPEHPPLVGVAARVGRDINDQGYKPGPSMAYVLYPVYLAMFRSSIGVIVSTLVVHMAGVLATLFFVRRWFGWRVTAITALVLAAIVRSLAPGFFLEPWNTWIPVFAYTLFLVLIAGVLLGHHRALPLAVAAGYHCLQTHISYVPLVAGALVPLVAWLIWTTRRSGEWRRPIAWSAAVTFVMWLPPVIEQLRPGPGNLRRVWEHFTNPPDETVGVRAAFRALAGEFNLAGPFVTGPGRDPTDDPRWWGFAAFIVVVLAGLAAWRRHHDRDLGRLYVVLGWSTLIGFYATSRVFGTFYDYVIRWSWLLAAFWMVASVWSISSDVDVRRRVARASAGLIPAIGGAAVLGLAITGSVASAGADLPYRSDSRLVANLGEQLEPSLDSDAVYLLRWHDPASLGGTGFGFVLEMEKRGDTLKVDPWAKATVRPYRSMSDERDADAVLWFVVGPQNIERFSQRDDAEKLAEFDPRSAAEVVESDELRDRIEKRIEELGHPDWITLLDSQYGHTQVVYNVDSPVDLDALVNRYNEIRLPGAVFRVPVGAPLYP